MCQFYFEELSLKNENIPSAAMFYCGGFLIVCEYACVWDVCIWNVYVCEEEKK